MDSDTVTSSHPVTSLHPEKDEIPLVALTHVEDTSNKPVSGIGKHLAQARTPEEAKAEKRFVLKTDLIILPLLASMYFLASLDRGDVGNAAVAGMTDELHLTPHQLSTCITIFYVGYIVFQLPGYLCLKLVRPPVQLGLALMLWGTFNTLICVAKSYQAVAGLRVGVGVGEAFLQAGPLYLSLWYKRDELATRGAIFFGMSAVAGAFNGIIAYGIEKNLNGADGWLAWRWLFLIEGVISVAWGFIVLALLPPLPEQLRWGFTEKEKVIARRRGVEGYNEPNAKIKPKQILDIFKDRRTYLYIILYSCLNLSLACFGSFLPVILRTFGYSPLETQALTIPVFFSAAVSAMGFGIASDRLQRRAHVLLACFVSVGMGWLILICSKSQHLSFAGCFFIGIGAYPGIIVGQVWMNNNTPGFTKRAAALGALGAIGQCFSIVGTQVYSDPPHYYRGNGFGLGASVIGGIATIVLYFDLRNENAKKRRDAETDFARSQRSLGIEDIGNRHPDFFYFT
ncbi:uncharacterized protein Z520_01857 [Fonsecaea multimorphosa CBS 102226]|uniref:Major facilitator superfamily (MFS) profile domain-containing protein n=1 Tax=Fonsecaea multimorphosa CBS 102226 TaxID=1442371 RepID=A0A0D2KY01_9EURO|nr:uncharacterized protein Z520_01857 [Fonsecaea multimorphosa CBS 102226]KIY01719.1 hypothetical protein Z520_01857 [Fonsecaea multimorphosa CBS 102226]OAL29914.1 hypothetical protein AYO22_01820 [Fonsecaea multimorphosa]